MRARLEPLRWPLRCVLLAYGLLALAAVSAAGFPEVRDPHSYADLTAFRTRHLALDLGVDFRAQRLTGTATLTLERRLPEARELTLDTRDLDIRRVTLIEARRERRLPFAVAPRDALLGSALRITLPADLAPGDDVVIRIAYRTSPTSTGLQWLAPRQTAGRKWPFLYSQSEALHARSWIPLQDTPQARITYTARIRTPRGLRAVMSAVNDPDTPLDGDYTLAMPQPIPSYLLALAVGDLDFRALGPRTGVYAEPATVQAAAAEFADTEAMLTAAEKLVGPYRWERYDLLLLPPSYALGGMENARLTFVTPTLLAGDRSLVAVIAHELAHSWSGNLVTNATWGDLWLNEGITCFLESSIVGAIYGADRQAQEDVLGWRTLERELARLPSAEQVLVRDLNGLDPDEYTEIPYEKGRAFLKFLERRFGSERFAAFLRAYFERFAFQSISTRDFRAFLDSELGSREPGRVTAEELDAWLYAPGLPASAVPPRSEAFTRVDELSGRWQRGELAAAALPVAGWSTQQWRHFLNSLPVLEPTKLAELDAAFGLTASTNAEIAASWLRQSVLAGYRPALPRLEQYLQTIGRRKLLLPLYEVLLRTPEGTAFARRVYAEARPGYQILVRTTLDPLIEGTR